MFSAQTKRRPGPKAHQRNCLPLSSKSNDQTPQSALRLSSHCPTDLARLRPGDRQRRGAANSGESPSPNVWRQRGGGPSWLSAIAEARDSLWSVDLFRCESILLNSFWVMVVMDVFSRRIAGFGVEPAPIDGSPLRPATSQAPGTAFARGSSFWTSRPQQLESNATQSLLLALINKRVAIAGRAGPGENLIRGGLRQLEDVWSTDPRG
jgi:hypothetical protein